MATVVSEAGMTDGAGRRIALLIGINQYEGGVPPLRNAVSDVEALGQILRDGYGYAVTRLCDGEATLAGLRAQFDQLTAMLAPADRLIVYFAGHGVAEELGDPGDGPQGYLLPQDAKREDVNTFLPMLELQRRLKELRCQHFLLFLDCCFAGAFRWSTTRSLGPRRVPVYRERFERYLKEPAWQVITSAAHDERALDVVAGRVLGSRGELERNSPFAAALVRGLSGEADLQVAGLRADGVITAQELFLYLEDTFSQLAQRLERSLQRPMLWSLAGRDKGQYVFLRPGHALQLPSAKELSEAHNPYRGLQIYTDAAEHEQLYFGRSAAIAALVAQVAQQTLVVVSGASGTGKSSLVRAGLVPRLRRSTNPSWHILAAQRPGQEPLSVLSRLAQEIQPGATQLPKAVTAWRAAHADTKLLLIVDQLEELVTLSSRSRDEFLRQIREVQQAGAGQVHWVLTLRSDYEPHFQDLCSPAATDSVRYLVPPFSREELREIIEGPAAERVLFFEPPTLVDRLLNEVVDMPGALPLLSFLLSEMYRASIRRPRDRTLSEADYHSLGGVSGALSKRADGIYAAYTQPVDQEAFRHLMLRMVAPGEIARQRVLESELQFSDEAETTRVIAIRDRLVDERLLVSDRDPRGRTFYEPAHDKLVLGWPLLSRFLVEDRAHHLHQELRGAANKWQESGRLLSRLWLRDPLLPPALSEAQRAPRRFNQLEADFLRQSRRVQGVAYGLLGLVALLLIGAVGSVAFVEKQRANEMQEHLHKTQVELGRRELLMGQPRKALAALREGQRRGSRDEFLGYMLGDAERWLQIGQPTLVAKPSGGLVMEADSFSPDGRYIVIPSHANTARVYDTSTGQLRHELIGSDNEIITARYSPDGTQILTCGEGKAAVLWDAENGRPLRSFQGHEGPVPTCTFSADGSRVATGSADQTARIWETQSARLLVTIKRSRPVVGVQFNTPGDVLLSRPLSGSPRIAATESGKELGDFVKGKCTPIYGEYSPDASRVLTVCLEGNVYLWARPDTEPLQLSAGVAAYATFSPDGLRVATAGRDKSARIFDVGSGVEVLTISEHKSVIHRVAFSTDGRRLVTASADGTARIFDLQTGGPLAVLAGHEGAVMLASFAPDGRQVFTVSSDRRVQLWRIDEGRGGRPLQLDWVPKTATISRDGRRIASSILDGGVRMMDGRDGRPLPMLGANEGDTATHLQFSPDGRWLATAGIDGRLRLLEVETGRVLLSLTLDSSLLQLAFRPTGSELALATTAGEAHLVSLPEGTRRQTLRSENDMLYWAIYDHTGERLATGGKGNVIQIWRASDGQLLRQMLCVGDSIPHAAFHPQDSRLVTIAGSSLQLWDSETGALQMTLPAEGGALEQVQFSPDGRRLLAANLDGEILIWELRSGRLITSLSATGGRFLSVSFSSDGQEVWAISTDGVARRFRVGATTHSGAEIDAYLRCRFASTDSHGVVGGAGVGSCGAVGATSGPELERTPYSDRMDAVYAGIWALRTGRRQAARQHLRRARASLPAYGDALGLAALTLAEGLLEDDPGRRAVVWAQIPSLLEDGRLSPADRAGPYDALRELAERSLNDITAVRFCWEQLHRLEPNEPQFLLELQISRVVSGHFAEALAQAEETYKLIADNIRISAPRKVFLWGFMWTAAVAQADQPAQDLWAGRLLAAYSAAPDGKLDPEFLSKYLRPFLRLDISELLGVSGRRRISELWEIMKDSKTFGRAQDLKELLQNQ